MTSPGCGEDGAGACRRPGGAAIGVSIRTPISAPFPRPGGSFVARRPGSALPRTLLLQRSSAGLQSQEAARAELEGAVGPAAPRHSQLVSRVPSPLRGSARGQVWWRVGLGPQVLKETAVPLLWGRGSLEKPVLIKLSEDLCEDRG